MLARCNTPSQTSYKRYGARGISVCKRWEKFENFIADMGEAPPSHEIDRIDNDGNYSPKNCRWTTRKDNNLNKRTTVWLTYDGQTKRLMEWAYFTRLPIDVLRQRVKLG